ncbi:MAG: MFS transporter [Dehalococcoidia bacterium]|nr:MFS transporter [Dehalococcoidia bacterium]
MLASGIFDKPTYRWWVFSAVALGTLTSVINHGGMSVALPTIAQHFNADLSTAQWVVIAEGLAISALILPMGRLSDIIGRKTVYLSGLVIFAAAAILAAGSQSILMLIAFKAVQGFGAAMTQGTGMAMVTSVFPAEERGRGIGSHASVVGSGGVIGPVVGGFLITALDWRWLFYVNFLMAVAAIIVVVMVIKSQAFTQDTRNRTYDFPGAALSTAVLLTFLLAVSNGARMGWGSPQIIVAALGFVVFLVAFVWWELRAPSPMLDMGLFRSKVFSIGISTNFMSFLGITSARFLMPFYLQAALGYTPAVVGIVLLPNAVSRIIMGPLSGRLSDRYGWRPFNIIGLLLSATGLFMLASLTVSSSVALVIAGILVQSVGSGLFQSPNSASIFSAADSSRHGVVAAFVNLSRNSGNVTGVAIATSIVTAVMASGGFDPNIDAVLESGPGSGILDSFMTGLKVAFFAMGVLQVIGATASAFKSDSRTEPASQAADAKTTSTRSR